MSRRPLCLIVTGRPGAGKTTLAQRLAAELHLPLVSRDALKEGYVRSQGLSHQELPAETNGLVTSYFFVTLQRHLAVGISLVAEAAFQHRIWAVQLPELQSHGLTLCVVCNLEETVAAERYRQRGLNNPWRAYFHGDLSGAHVEGTGRLALPAPYQPPTLAIPTLAVDTTEAYTPSFTDIVSFVLENYG
ncbi:MAG: AAA family ATPase [Anaerolineales bacterium]|nr:AAA family ATPase [Anaerolineales bacterium]